MLLRRTVLTMVRRRKNPEQWVTAQKPSWLAVYNPPERKPMESTPLQVGVDTRAVMRDAIDRWSRDGWTVESDGRYGSFFCNRGTERLEVRAQATDPSQPVPLRNTSPF
jgi:hypothetical protein